jgi:hypothetical protein
VAIVKGLIMNARASQITLSGVTVLIFLAALLGVQKLSQLRPPQNVQTQTSALPKQQAETQMLSKTTDTALVNDTEETDVGTEKFLETDIPPITWETTQSKENILAWIKEFRGIYPRLESSNRELYITYVTFISGNSVLKIGEAEGANSVALNYFMTLISANPEAFVALTLESDFNEDWDPTMHTALFSYIDTYNVSIIEPYLDIDKNYLVDLGIEHDLHIQSPSTYMDLFKQYTKKPEEPMTEEFLVGMAEIDPWGVRDYYLERAVNSKYPQSYFSALESMNEKNLHGLAKNMWARHKQGSYPKSEMGGTGNMERVEVAIIYGIDEAWDELYELLMEGFFVKDVFTSHLKLENPKVEFPKVRNNLVYDSKGKKWSIQ